MVLDAKNKQKTEENIEQEFFKKQIELDLLKENPLQYNINTTKIELDRLMNNMNYLRNETKKVFNNIEKKTEEIAKDFSKSLNINESFISN